MRSQEAEYRGEDRVAEDRDLRQVHWMRERCRYSMMNLPRAKVLGANADTTAAENGAVQDPTERRDAYEAARRALIHSFARAEHVEAVLWGDSTTNLAQRVLGLVAKGKGGDVPALMNEGPASELGRVGAWGGEGEGKGAAVDVYPLRDLLKGELLAYAATVEKFEGIVEEDEGEGEGLGRRAGGTIDGLMGKYFADTEREYPSIVANVVRTAGRLKDPRVGVEVFAVVGGGCTHGS